MGEVMNLDLVMVDIVVDMGVMGEAKEALVVVEVVNLGVVEGAVLMGLKKYNLTTRSLSRVYQQMLLKRILLSFLAPSV